MERVDRPQVAVFFAPEPFAAGAPAVLGEDAARPIVYRYDLGTCHYPRVKNVTTQTNSIFNSWRFESTWLDQ